MNDTPQAVDKKVVRPDFWKKLKGIISVVTTGRGIMYMSNKKGGWGESPFLWWREHGTFVERLSDGRIRREIDFEQGKAKEVRGRIWDDERFGLSQKSPNYEETAWRGETCVRKERLFRQQLIVTPMKNDKPEGVQEVYRRIDEKEPVTGKTKTLGDYYLCETQEYRNGLIDGERRCYYQNGALQEVGTFKSKMSYCGYSESEFKKMVRYKPELDKAMLMTDELGRVVRVTSTMSAFPVGTRESYYPNGRLESYTTFDENGMDATVFDEDGNVSSAIRDEEGRSGGYVRDERDGALSLYFRNDDRIKTVEIDATGHRSVSVDKVQPAQMLKGGTSISLNGFYSAFNDKGQVVEMLYKDNMLVQRVTFEGQRPVLAERINELGEAVSFPPEERIKRANLSERLKEMGFQVQKMDPSRTQKLPEELFKLHVPVNEKANAPKTSSKKISISRAALKQIRGASK